MHTVADIYCVCCEGLLGWRYEEAEEPSQKYKEGEITDTRDLEALDIMRAQATFVALALAAAAAQETHTLQLLMNVMFLYLKLDAGKFILEKTRMLLEA
jgi:hypothetical protein